MAFQSGINQLLGMTALFSQLPAAQNLKEKRQINAGLKNLDAQQEELANAVSKQYDELEGREFTTPEAKADAYKAAELAHEEMLGELGAKRQKLYDRKFELDPSKPGMAAAPYSERFTKQVQKLADERAQAELAKQSMQQKGQAQVIQQQDYSSLLNSIRNESTSLGGQVKDLPLAIQQRIIQAYQEDGKK